MSDEIHRDASWHGTGVSEAWLNLRHPQQPGIWVQIDYEALTVDEARSLAAFLLTAADRIEGAVNA
jgi:hypothetical protein